MNCEELSLRWQDHHEALLAVFENLLRSNTLVDCTLAAEGRTLKAHKVVLSACSPYFQTVFKEESEKHPIIILKDVKFWTLKAVVDFVYRGEVKIRENQLGAFLEVAESLQIKGLGTGTDEESEEKEAASNFSEQSRDVSTSPTPRKRIRRNRSSVSEGDNNVTDFNSLNNNCQYSPQHQNQSTKASNTPSTSDISIPAHGAVSNSNSSVSGTRSNDSKFETNQHSKRILPLDKSSCPENVPVIKLEPEDSKLDFSDEAADDLMEYRTVVKDMDAGLNADPIHGQSNPHVYADFAQSYVETEDQDPKHPFMSGQEVPLHSLQDLPSSNVETVDLSSDDSSFTQRDYSSRGGHGFVVGGGGEGDDGSGDGGGATAAAADYAGRKHACTFCPKRFCTPTKLATHVRTHTGERPFACGTCGRAFRQPVHLRSHAARVHGQLL
ncbi:hypothetical protein R5R35_010036 [Gryllus longicercus]|uniref:Uncharacterized protein n=1 Tax=Gryllus longicercus TaxID=2509291 RepID=A0AAN9VSU8_9ORTH